MYNSVDPGPAQQVFEWGGGGEGGALERQINKDESTRGSGEKFDFNSSEMPRNAFKINQRNP